MIIEKITWGKIEVGDQIYKDLKIHNNIKEEWNWKKTKTEHDPGVQIIDVIDFIDKVDHIILSTGYENKLKIKQETIRYIEYKKKSYSISKTDEAVETYNNLVRKGYSVGALIHSTC